MIERPKDYESFVALARGLRIDTRDLGEGLEQRVLARLRRECVARIGSRFFWTLTAAYGGVATAAASFALILENTMSHGAYAGLISYLRGGLVLVYGG